METQTSFTIKVTGAGKVAYANAEMAAAKFIKGVKNADLTIRSQFAGIENGKALTEFTFTKWS